MVWTFLFGYFRNINVLKFIHYFVIFCIFSYIHNEVFKIFFSTKISINSGFFFRI